MKRICVVGSLNMDLVVTAEHFPQPGETLMGQEFATYPGGKGANQAVAAGRLQADVRIIGKVGNDSYGNQELQNLKENGVQTFGVGIEPDIASGVAIIEVDGTGENHIIVVPGANKMVDRNFIDSQFDKMVDCDIFLLQLEIPLETVFYTLRKLKENGKTVILDPAPAIILADEFYPQIDYLTPNLTELSIIAETEIVSVTDLRQSAQKLLKKGVRTIIVKAGKDGAYIINKNGFEHIPGFKIKTIDTTGAGDSFNAGLAVALSQGKELTESIKFANAVGALSTTAKGAQNAMPTLEQVKLFLCCTPNNSSF